jgi:hypothetical protein
MRLFEQNSSIRTQVYGDRFTSPEARWFIARGSRRPWSCSATSSPKRESHLSVYATTGPIDTGRIGVSTDISVHRRLATTYPPSPAQWSCKASADDPRRCELIFPRGEMTMMAVASSRCPGRRAPRHRPGLAPCGDCPRPRGSTLPGRLPALGQSPGGTRAYPLISATFASAGASTISGSEAIAWSGS